MLVSKKRSCSGVGAAARAVPAEAKSVSRQENASRCMRNLRRRDGAGRILANLRIMRYCSKFPARSPVLSRHYVVRRTRRPGLQAPRHLGEEHMMGAGPRIACFPPISRRVCALAFLALFAALGGTGCNGGAP